MSITNYDTMAGFQEYPGREFVAPDGSRWTRQIGDVANWSSKQWAMYTSPDHRGAIVWEGHCCEDSAGAWVTAAAGFTWHATQYEALCQISGDE